MDIKTLLSERNKSLAEFSKHMRIRRGWSQEYVADLLGVSRAMIVRFESGESTLEVAQVELLCIAFGFDLNYFHQSTLGSGKHFEQDMEIALQNVGLPRILDQPAPLLLPSNSWIDITVNPEGLLDFCSDIRFNINKKIWDNKGQANRYSNAFVTR